MNNSPLLKVLPLIVIAVAISGGILVYQQRAAMQARLKDLLDRAQKEATTKLPEPTPFIPVRDEKDKNPVAPVTPTPTPTKQANNIDKNNEANSGSKTTTKGGQTVSATSSNKKTIITKETICTPVYGMAETCAEHVVVDTAVDSSLFYNLAGLSYLGGLAAFIKAKRK